MAFPALFSTRELMIASRQNDSRTVSLLLAGSRAKICWSKLLSSHFAFCLSQCLIGNFGNFEEPPHRRHHLQPYDVFMVKSRQSNSVDHWGSIRYVNSEAFIFLTVMLNSPHAIDQSEIRDVN